MMQKKNSTSASYEDAAERVKFLLERAKLLVLSLWMERKGIGSLRRLMKYPRITASADRLFLFGYKLSSEMKKREKKAGQVITETCSRTSKTALFPFEYREYKGSELNKERVQNLKMKERVLAARKLKNLQSIEQRERGFTHAVTLFGKKEDMKKKEEDSAHEQWQGLLQQKEERHFQIGRVIKYLCE